MTAAQQHLLLCDACAAHDTMMRRSLMLARNIPSLGLSEGFEGRLRMRLAECKKEAAAPAHNSSLLATRVLAAAVAAGLVAGVVLWQGMTPTGASQTAVQPVIAVQSAPLVTKTQQQRRVSPVSPALMQAMATGNPVWPATMILDEMPTHLINASYGLTE